MEYKALYREYRPKTFDEVVGQGHVVEALRNSVRNKRVAHAYLFCGTRGTGKTSVAKILSRAVNCLEPANGNPCNKCRICRGILSESLLDVIEIDAASNNSVDNVRDIREEVVYLPAEANYKIYIVDEVHMLSPGAFNALLKTLEEPPAHVIFILATTEPYKLPATILSRCQRFDFKRIPFNDIYKLISEVCGDLGVEAEKKALDLIARVADGALRDALSILDKCISVTEGKLTFANTLALTGISDQSIIKRTIEAIVNGETDEIIQQIDRYEKNGLDFKFFLTEMLEYLRNILVCDLTDEPSKLILADDDVIADMQELSKAMGRDMILKIIHRVSELNKDFKQLQKAKVFIEITLLDLTFNNKNIQSKVKAEPEAEIAANRDKMGKKEAPADGVPDPEWEKVIKMLDEKGEKIIATYLAGTALEYANDRYTILFDPGDSFKKNTVGKSEKLNKIREVLGNLLGKDDIILGCEFRSSNKEEEEETGGFSEAGVKSLFEGIPIDIID